MIARVMPSAVLIVLTALTLTGCGRQAAKKSAPDLNLLATGPDRQALPTPRPFVSAASTPPGGWPLGKSARKSSFMRR